MLCTSKPRCFSLLDQWTNQIAGDPHLRPRRQATPRPGEIFSCHEWHFRRCSYIKRAKGVTPSLFLLPVLTFVFAISASSSDTLLLEPDASCFPSHSFSLLIPSVSQYEVLRSPQRARPRCRCRCPADYSHLRSRFLDAVYFDFCLLDSGAELSRKL